MKIVIIHFRLGKSDGVSLEIDKRVKVLEELGHEVHFIGGECSEEFKKKNAKRLSIVPELHLVKERTVFLQATAVKAKQMNLPETVLIHWFAEQEYKIYKKLDEIFSKYNFDGITVHNLLSNPIILPATNALVRILDKYEIPTLAIHHDFYFERGGFLDAPYRYVTERIKQLPPKRFYLTHNVISSIAQKGLSTVRGISADIIGDVWDYKSKPQKKDKYNSDLRERFRIKEHDVFVLQSTRITQNKCIENAILFCHELEKKLKKQAPLDVFGRRFNKDSKVILFLSNGTDGSIPGAKGYLVRLLKLADKLNVTVINGTNLVERYRRHIGSKKIYSFWDVYPHADLMTYPSCQEGFGNQLLEAFFYRKLPVIFEYPVFKTDIKPDGYGYISLGDVIAKNGGVDYRSLNLIDKNVAERAAEKTLEVIRDPGTYKKLVDENFVLANRYHSMDSLKSNLQNWLKRIQKGSDSKE